MARKGGRSRPKRRGITSAIAHIQSTYNNTIVTITDLEGNTLCWASSGTVGFKGTKKGTPFAAQMAAQAAGKRALDIGVKSLQVYVKGPGSGRETAVRALESLGFRIEFVKDITPTPHNGCRPAGRRRV
ncbi:MAG: 30S ribosomal protein S11 [Armatimonadota bacterium]|nr:30S ribosomal protein S11 [Armatimonadota bacterium]MDW8024739.1 30S ribosomal protein S11 [Armatimonadota bacterium]